MLAQLFLWVIVGLAAASNPGWRENKEYVYKIDSRTLTFLEDIDSHHSGFLYNAEMRVQPRSDGLWAQITRAEYSPFHSQLGEWADSYIPRDQLSWQPLRMSSKSFKIVMTNGKISELIVNKETPNWEANIIKGIVSQFQLNTNANDLIQSNLNSLPQGQDSAVFKTMEDTVTGNAETLYTIKRLPEHIVQKSPWYRVEKFQEGEEDVLEVMKHKNYTNYEELPSYSYGFGEMRDGEPGTNMMADSIARTSTTHAIITGNLNRYTLQHSITTSEIMVRPTLHEQQVGRVVSRVNVTLKEVKPKSGNIEDVTNPLSLENLVYSYEQHPFSGSNLVRERRTLDSMKKMRMMGMDMRTKTMNMIRTRRSLEDEQLEYPEESEKYYHQDRPQLNEAPETPLLPYTMGYKGQSIKKSIDIVRTVQTLATEIGKALQNPEEVFEEEILSKFVTMTSLVRLMDSNELHQVAGQLYTKSEEPVKHDIWTTFRDAVAESGTGPALLVIKDWVEQHKIKGQEASQVLSTFSDSVRHPTFELMQTYFVLVESSCQSQWPLNDTALLSYSTLARKVFINREHSKKNYPVNSFGRFDNREGLVFVKETVIPYLQRELEQAIQKAETHRIHTLILSLGNIAHPQILAAFEPYLEGDKQVSQFQRFLMVVGLEKLAEVYPNEARPVLFKIYQNSGEEQEIRAAAVYQLMKTRPAVEVLQLLASNTNTDRHEHVNAAVKSLIEEAAELEDDDQMRRAAETARPLLTKEIYGKHLGSSIIRDYLNKELHAHYQVQLETIGSQDTFLPKGYSYKWSAKVGGIHQKYVTVRAMVSSIQEMTRVLKQQTETYKRMQEQQQENFEKQQQNPWSSQSIARFLNMKPEEREQMEGLLQIDLDDSIMAFLPFDNNTLRNLPEVIRMYEQLLKNEMQVRYTKFIDNHEVVLSLPTEAGVPFLYTLHNPKAIKVEGSIKADFNPTLYQQGLLRIPKEIRIKSDLSVTITSKAQGQLSFVTPFDHQQYMTGFDKQCQIHLPLHGKHEIDIENQQIKFEFEVEEKHSGAHLFQYKSTPYTSRFDITDFKPVLRKPETKEIKQENLHAFKTVLGQKETGVALQVNYVHERQSFDMPTILSNIWNKNAWVNFKLLWNDAKVQWSRFSLKYLPEGSSTKRIIFRLGFQKKQFSSSEGYNGERPTETEDSQERQQRVMKKVASGLENVQVQAYDASVEFQGAQNFEHILTGAFATREVNPLDKWCLYYQKKSENSPFVVMFESKSQTPITHTLDMKYSLEQEPKIETDIELAFGTHEPRSKIQAKIEMRRSEERKQYLKAQPEYFQGLYELREGNSQLPAGLNITVNAGLLDRITANIRFQNLHPVLRSYVENWFQLISYKYWPSMEFEGQHQSLAPSEELLLEAKFHPDLRYVNVTLKSQDDRVLLKNIFVPEIAKEIFVVHPFFYWTTRVQKYITRLPSYLPTCVVDQTKANNFNNHTFPVEISEHWTTMLQYVPKLARQHEQPETVEEQLKHQLENLVVLVRKNKQNPKRKDLKIVFSAPQTQYEIVDVTFTPQESSNRKFEIQVNEQSVRFQPRETKEIMNGYGKFLALDNGEVKFVLGDLFYVIYDGQRIRFSAMSWKLKDNVRGICGQFNGEEMEDMLTSENCIARDIKDFIRSFEVEGSEGKRLREEFSRQTNKCVPKQLPLYVNVIDYASPRKYQSGSCTRFQTQYVEQNGEICFTIRPQPVCGRACQGVGNVTKNVPVHCIQKSNAALLWKKQIDQGANPDFSYKQETRSVPLTIPQSCEQY